MKNQSKQSLHIEDVGLSKRTETCLRRLKIKTINQLTLLNKQYLLKQKGFGRRTIAELELVLNKHNLCFEDGDKGGRPKIEFDLKQVEGLASIQATYDEMAAVLGCSRETIINRMEDDESFSTAYKRGKEKGKVSLRRIQWRAAQGIDFIAWLCDKKQAVSTEYICDERKAKSRPECMGCRGAREKKITIFKSGATGMQIWLGKQWLGQQDKAALEHSGSGGGPIKTEGLAITKEMSAKEAANIYARMIKEGNLE